MSELFAAIDDFRGSRDRLYRRHVTIVLTVLPISQHLFFRISGRISDDDLEHEAVELRFRKRIRAFEFDWILGGYDHEQFRKILSSSFQTNLTLFHCFKESRLS